jgi:hypothetical protein
MPFSDDYTDSETDSTTDESDDSEPSTSDLEFIDDGSCSSESGSESDAEVTPEETVVGQPELDFIRQCARELASHASAPESDTVSGTDPTEVQEEVADEGAEYDSCEGGDSGESDELYAGEEDDTDESEEESDVEEDEAESDVGSDEGEDGTVGDTDDEETDGGPDEEDDESDAGTPDAPPADTEAPGSPRLPLKRPRAARGDGHARFKRALVSLIKEAL